MPEILIQSWTQGLPPPRGTAVVFDIFRCSTTIHCLASRRPNNLWIAPHLRNPAPLYKTLRIYSELQDQPECLERFDNSPARALTHPEKHDALVATTTGTPGMFTARDYPKVLVGSLVSFSKLLAELHEEKEAITLIPATFPKDQHVEDNIVAEAVRDSLLGRAPTIQEIIERIHASGRPEYLYKKLPRGKEDVAVCLDADRFDFLPRLEFIPHQELAKVVL